MFYVMLRSHCGFINTFCPSTWGGEGREGRFLRTYLNLTYRMHRKYLLPEEKP